LRPEYIEAIDAVRWGWSFWIAFWLPAAIIWLATFSRPIPEAENRVAVGCGFFALACFLCWIFIVMHGNLIQSAKERHMETQAEMDDFTTDTWHLNASVTAVPIAVIYCGLNLAFAAVVRNVLQWTARCVRRILKAEDPAEKGRELTRPGNE